MKSQSAVPLVLLPTQELRDGELFMLHNPAIFLGYCIWDITPLSAISSGGVVENFHPTVV